MENPPPVPPKDTPPHKRAMESREPSAAPPSGSKRKREGHDDTIYDVRNGRLEVAADPDAHTPKRSRSHLRQSDNDASDDATPVQPRNVRRKKGVRNLSNLNLRHAAQQQAHAQAEAQAHAQNLANIRESRFQEGSLTDKPSNKPPSAFTRIVRSESGNLQHVEDLMADYHDEVDSALSSAGVDVAHERAVIPQRIAEITAQREAREAAQENDGFLSRIGRSLAASMHPVRMWRQVWDETKEELTQKNLAEIEHKRLLKEEAERRYAQMKVDGEFTFKPITHVNAPEASTPRDSGIAMSVSRPSQDTKRLTSYGSQLTVPLDDPNGRSESEAPETGNRVIRTIRSRLFKRPSMASLRPDLKRISSDYNLAASATAARESSSSVSPVKIDFESSALRRSVSKIDLKKQNKLSKRVSDLELKLQHARRELDTALIQASPMPKLGNKYERWTPNSTLKRPRFVPGQLPSLPSERLLDPAQMMAFEMDSEATPAVKAQAREEAAAALEGQPRKALDLKVDMSEDEETVKVTRAKAQPPHVATLFKLDNYQPQDSQDTQQTTEGATEHENDSKVNDKHAEDAMDLDTNIDDFEEPTQNSTQTETEAKESIDYASLDAKLKALDASVNKAAKKPAKGKKRKSDEAKLFEPTADSDDDEEWGQAKGTPKRRKSKGATKNDSPHTKPGKAKASESSPISKKTTTIEQTIIASEPVIAVPEEIEDEPETLFTSTSNNDIDMDIPTRSSMDSQTGPLEPVFEEEEEDEDSTSPTTDELSKPFFKATSARYGRSRSRSASPAKRTLPPGEEEKLMMRAAAAAQQHRGLGEEGAEVQKEVVVAVAGGKGKKKRSARGKGVGRGAVEGPKEGFEWPEDVF